MAIIEKIGQFYLGQESYPDKGKLSLYNSADLTTHAVIIGMTGSGKTGLGICLLEEAALDNVPVIAIDPKGDLGNLALNFPELSPADFQPWADLDTLSQNKLSPEQWANNTAQLWKNGIEKSGQNQTRMRLLKTSNPVHIYTPGSSTGIPISLLTNLVPPDEIIMEDRESYAQYLDASTSGLLSLLQEDNDPLSAKHVFLTQVLKSNWDHKQSLTLEYLIQQILKPSFDKIGILPLEQVFSSKDRQTLAMSLNNLLASPSFAGWRIGQALDVQTLFYDRDKDAQTSILNIAHLSDSERMFFITLLLNNLINWMRRQPGTSSLRAILYMDEIAGYLPPNMNPPSKALFLTLLKQARAFGLGLVLSTQNPIDLDYKALSNAGTWCIGKLQTAQDRARVTDGLLSAGEKGIQKKALDQWFDKLGKRQFLLHNIHENQSSIFETRWAMSYLAGPLNKRQIETLTAADRQFHPTNTVSNTTTKPNQFPVVLPEGIEIYYSPSNNNHGNVTHYFPTIIASSKLFFNDKKSNTQHYQMINLQNAIPSTQNSLDWKNAQVLDFGLDQLQREPQSPFNYRAVSAYIQNKSTWQDWEKSFKTFLRQNHHLQLYYCPTLDIYSDAGENERQFRNRLSPLFKEQRDQKIANIKKKHVKKQATIDKKIITAETRWRKEKNDASQSLLNTGISIIDTLLGFFTGRKSLSQHNISKTSTTLRKTNKLGQDRREAKAAEEKLLILKDEKQLLTNDFAEKLNQVKLAYDPSLATLEKATIDVKSTDIVIRMMGILYQPLSATTEQQNV